MQILAVQCLTEKRGDRERCSVANCAHSYDAVRGSYLATSAGLPESVVFNFMPLEFDGHNSIYREKTTFIRPLGFEQVLRDAP